MKILSVEQLAIPDVQAITFSRHCDMRGYFTETYRKSAMRSVLKTRSSDVVDFVQCNESFSRANVVRGLHFQWNPYMGKLVRTLKGRMIDIVLDIRKGGPTFGKAILHDMPCSSELDFGQWIWVPPGFAHGNAFIEDTVIEYLCTGEYNKECEACISPFAPDIDWSMCSVRLRDAFFSIQNNSPIITDKDKNGFSVREWFNDSRADNFLFQYE